MPDPRVIDGRGLLPPEPLELAVAALGAMQPGDQLVMLLHCEPLPLYSILEPSAYRHRSELRTDGTNEIHIEKL